MRLTDDLVDANDSTADAADANAALAERLDFWRDATRAATSDGARTPPFDRRDFPNGAEYSAVLSALRAVRRRFSIPIDALSAVVDGMKLDLGATTRAATLAESLDYCDKAATAVGIALLAILGTSAPLDSPEVLAPARGCGRALQWTNFLRDVAEDVRRDRAYFPATDFAAVGLDVERWRRFATSKTGVRDARAECRDADSPLSRFFRLQFERTAAFFREAEPLFPLVAADSRRPLRLMCEIYRAIFQKIEAAPYRVFGERVRASRRRKAALALAVILGSLAK